MIGRFLTDEKGKILNTPSPYTPGERVTVLTGKVKQDYEIGYEIMHRPFREFNDMSVLERARIDALEFNAYVEPRSTDPDESWHSNAKRPLLRNKLISLAAHITARILAPGIFAQNDNDEEDKDASFVMKEINEWVIRSSNYEKAFIFGVVNILSAPVCYLSIDYVEVMQKIKERATNGSMTTKEILDEILSGFIFSVLSVDQVFIDNPYEFEIQKQRFIGIRKLISYDEAKAKYGNHPDFTHVTPGVVHVFDADSQLWYQTQNEELGQTLIEEFTYLNRTEDLELCYLNGILVSDPDQNIRHRDNKNRPKYKIAKSGGEPIDGMRFFFYKSFAHKLYHEQRLVDRMWRIFHDFATLNANPPIGYSGENHIDGSVIFPGQATPFGPNSQVFPILPRSDLTGVMNSLNMLEKSMAEGSQDTLQQGVASSGDRTKYEIQRLEANALTNLGLLSKMIGFLVKDIGVLMVDSAIQHLTVPDVHQIIGGANQLKFRTIFVPNRIENGKKVSNKIAFSIDEYGPEDEEARSFKAMEEEGGYESDMRLYVVNPEKFAQLKFQVYVEPDFLTPKNDVIERASKMEAFAQIAQVPQFFKMDKVARDLLAEPIFKGNTDEYMADQQPAQQKLPPGVEGQQPQAMPELTPSLKGLIQNQVMS